MAPVVHSHEAVEHVASLRLSLCVVLALGLYVALLVDVLVDLSIEQLQNQAW